MGVGVGAWAGGLWPPNCGLKNVTTVILNAVVTTCNIICMWLESRVESTRGSQADAAFGLSCSARASTVMRVCAKGASEYSIASVHVVCMCAGCHGCVSTSDRPVLSQYTGIDKGPIFFPAGFLMWTS